MKIQSKIRELMARNPPEKFAICIEMCAVFIRPLGVNIIDVNYRRFWGTYYMAIYICFVVFSFVYDILFRWEFKIMDVLPIVTIGGIAIPVSCSFCVANRMHPIVSNISDSDALCRISLHKSGASAELSSPRS